MWTPANVLLCSVVGKMDQPCSSGSPPETVCLHVMGVMQRVGIKGDGLQHVKFNKYIVL